MSPRPLSALGRAFGYLVAARTAAEAAPPHAAEEQPPEGDGQGPEFDPRERRVPANPRAELVVAGLLLGAAVLGFGFVAVYIVASTDTQLMGLTFGGALALLAAACIVAGKAVVPQEIHVEERGLLLEEEQTEEVVEMIESGGEGISRRGLLVGAGGAPGAAVVAAGAAPLASLGPKLDGIHQTPWKRGVRLVDDKGRPFRADEIQIGTFYTALPEGGQPEHFAAGLLVVKLAAQEISLPYQRRDWAPEGILAYSKICPHAGCAISQLRYPTYEKTSQKPALTCPCHYSTFLPGEGGRLLFGPAGRALPQLPLMIDGEGYLRAAGSFKEDIGPAWWNTHRGQS